MKFHTPVQYAFSFVQATRTDSKMKGCQSRDDLLCANLSWFQERRNSRDQAFKVKIVPPWCH